jgi:hypothetical protein
VLVVAACKHIQHMQTILDHYVDQLRYVHRTTSYQISDETCACVALQLLLMHNPVMPPGQDVFIQHIVAEGIIAERLLSNHHLLNAVLTDQTLYPTIV